MVMSDFRPEVEIRPFRACAMKNMQCSPYLWPNRRNLRVIKEIWVDEHDGDVRFKSGSGNMAVSYMRNASSNNYYEHFVHCGLGRYHVPQNAFLVTALHGMQSRYSDGNSVCPSVCPSVCLSVRLSNACIVTKRKKAMFKFLYHMKEHLS